MSDPLAPAGGDRVPGDEAEESELRAIIQPAAERPAIDLARDIVRMQLASKELVRLRLKTLDVDTGDAMIAALENAGELTDFQASELRRGQYDYLALGPIRPQYLISAGAFARVFRGVDVRRKPDDPKRDVAVKILRERWKKRPGMIDMFRREGELGQRLTHQNIVPTYEVDCDCPTPYLTMEFVEGGDLRTFLKGRSKLSAADAMRTGLDICRGLEYALQFGVAHRDMKLSNVLMSANGRARLIDFGLAADEKLLDEAELHNALEYATLEKYAEQQFRVPNPPGGDPRTDLYLLGTVLYELVSGQPPFKRTSSRDERKSIGRYRNVPSLATHVPDVPRAVDAVIDVLMQINPNDRYQSPTEAATAIQAALVSLGEGAAVAGAKTSDGRTLRTLLCVENRPKHQDVLREYFGKHQFRVLLLGNPERAIARLSTTPPDALVFMGDAIGGVAAIEHFKQAITHPHPPACVLVLPKKMADAKATLGDLPAKARVLVQPATVRELRDAIEACLDT